jgi:hypothetical protein
MLGIVLQQRELFVGAVANGPGKVEVGSPEARGRLVIGQRLERTNSTGLLIIKGAKDEVVQATSRQVVCNAIVNGLRAMLVEPIVELLQLVLGEILDCSFDLVDVAHAACSLLNCRR